MAFTTWVKTALNDLIAPLNIKVDTLTATRIEDARMQRMQRSGYFERSVFPLISGFSDFDPVMIERALLRYSREIGVLMGGGAHPGYYDPTNSFFRSPDAEILYLMVRTFTPRRIVEVGSGNSTRIIRQAIADGGLSVAHVAIDPAPRTEIGGLVDHLIPSRFEDTDVTSVVADLDANDMLIIDSSHEVRVGNDVAHLFCSALPALANGVIVHIHDVFLPFDYPERLGGSYPNWGEQYLLQVYLKGNQHEILWPGYYLQKARPELIEKFPFLAAGPAQSLWLRVGFACSTSEFRRVGSDCKGL